MFRSTLHVAHISTKRWELTRPLVWEGKWQYIGAPDREQVSGWRGIGGD